MPEIVVFIPGADASAQQNLERFIELCRNQLTAFGADLPFDEDVWDVSNSIDRRGHGNKRERIRFSHGSFRGAKEIWLVQPFRDFAKAFMRYSHAFAPVKNLGPRLSSLRMVERALSDLGLPICITSLSRAVLDRAATLAREHFKGGAAYQCGKKLEHLAKLGADIGLASGQVRRWKSPIPKERDDLSRIGPEFEKRRAELLPSDDELHALARAYRVAESPLDLVITRIAALMCCAPDRINEVLALPFDCEVERERPDGTREFGLQWPGSKGKDDHIKWILPTFETLAREALSQLKELTAEGRKIAAWYELNPKSLYLPENLEHLRDKALLNAEEFVSLAAVTGKKAQWYKPRGIRPISTRPWLIRFADVEAAILQSLPRNFPVADKRTGLHLKDALFVFPQHFGHQEWKTSQCAIEIISTNTINKQLGSRLSIGMESVFSRHGITLPDGSPVTLTTKQFRHFLNTVAQGAGLGQFEIAKWSGRADVRQNIAYDHVSADELLTECEDLLGLDDSDQTLMTSKRAPVSIQQFKSLGFLTAHTTECGFCVHDFVMLPCQLMGDCDNCEEHVCVKGDEVRTKHIKRRLAVARELLESAEVFVTTGRKGADRWLEHHRKTVARLSCLVEILDDPSTPEGTLIRLDGTGGSTLIEAAVQQALGPLNHADTPPSQKPLMLEQVRRIASGLGAA